MVDSSRRINLVVDSLEQKKSWLKFAHEEGFLGLSSFIRFCIERYIQGGDIKKCIRSESDKLSNLINTVYGICEETNSNIDIVNRKIDLGNIGLENEVIEAARELISLLKLDDELSLVECVEKLKYCKETRNCAIVLLDKLGIIKSKIKIDTSEE
jgi:hypothetical protein